MQSHPLRNAERSATLEVDKQRLTKDVEVLNGPLTLEAAIARTIKYNAERQLKKMEEALAAGALEASNYDMLPKLVASAGYRDRNDDFITRSEDSVTGLKSLANPFISSARSAATTELTFSWSLLDFGQSYYAARQNADRVLIAQERRRKSLHLLIQDVRTAYWRVVAAQLLKSSVQSAIIDGEDALKDAKRAETERLRNPLETLRFQRQLLENLRMLEAVQQELSAARIDLASLASLPLSGDFTVATPPMEVNSAWLDVPITLLEEQALHRNADLRESMYNARIAQQETRRTMLRLFPGLSFNYGNNTSTDSYLINQSWRDASAQISFNLLNLFSLPSQMRLADLGVSLAEQKRMVIQMTVLTQLHIARLQYANALHQYERADMIADVEDRITQQVTNQQITGKQTKLERIAQKTTQILAQLRRYQAMAAVRTAASHLQATLGMEPVIGPTVGLSVHDLAVIVQKSLQAWDSAQFPMIDTTPEKATHAATPGGTSDLIPHPASHATH